MIGKNRGGRPPAPANLQRVNVPLRLPTWLRDEIDKLPGTRADVIEEAICKRHKLKPPPASTDK